jgi:hypothetical protein
MTYALVQRDNIGSKQIFDTFEDLLAALPEDTSNYDIEVLSAEDEEDEEPVFGDGLGFADEPDVIDDLAKLGAEAFEAR